MKSGVLTGRGNGRRIVVLLQPRLSEDVYVLETKTPRPEAQGQIECNSVVLTGEELDWLREVLNEMHSQFLAEESALLN